MAKMIQCSFCAWGDVSVPDQPRGTGVLLQSTRFPTVFIHGTCRHRAREILEAGGFDWTHYPFLKELLFCDEGYSLAPQYRYTNQQKEFRNNVRW